MARLSRRFSRYFSLSSRRSSAANPRIHKSKISKPILAASEEDTHTLLTSSSHTYTHSHSSSIYTLSDAELHSIEQQKLGRKIEDDIDDIIASYAHVPPTRTADPFNNNNHNSNGNSHDALHTNARNPPATASPTPSSSYSSPPSSPPMLLKAKLDRFRDTPPPAPGWEKMSFGRETGLFGPDVRSRLPQDHVFGGGVLADEGRAGRRKDWRGEFGRRGYDVL